MLRTGLSMHEAHTHPHNQAREAFIKVGDHRQPAPAPRFGTTKLALPRPPGSVPLAEALAAWNLSEPEIAALTKA